jgi:predicted transcriptional regulator
MVEITTRQRLLGSVLHAGAALDLFTTEQHEWGTTEIAEALALPKSSAHALLASLTEIGLLERTPDRRFRLGHKLLGFGETVLAGSEVFNAMRNMLSELMQRLGRSVYLAVRDGQHVVYINRMQGPSSVPAFAEHRRNKIRSSVLQAALDYYMHMHISFCMQAHAARSTAPVITLERAQPWKEK